MTAPRQVLIEIAKADAEVKRLTDELAGHPSDANLSRLRALAEQTRRSKCVEAYTGGLPDEDIAVALDLPPAEAREQFGPRKP